MKKLLGFGLALDRVSITVILMKATLPRVQPKYAMAAVDVAYYNNISLMF
jgi:hypothetical protein